MALVVKNLPANAGDIRDTGLILGSGRSPEGRHGNPLQYSCLENPMDRGAWQATVHSVAKSRTQLKRLSMHACMFYIYIYSTGKKSESHSVMSDSLEPHGLNSPCNSPGQNNGVNGYSLLQGIFPTRGPNLGLPHCGQILYQLSHQGRPSTGVSNKCKSLQQTSIGRHSIWWQDRK